MLKTKMWKMPLAIVLSLAMVAVLALPTFAYAGDGNDNGGGDQGKSAGTITFVDSQNTSTVYGTITRSVSQDGDNEVTVTGSVPADPTTPPAGFSGFAGWFTDLACTQAWNQNSLTTPGGAYTVYAGWTVDPNAQGGGGQGGGGQQQHNEHRKNQHDNQHHKKQHPKVVRYTVTFDANGKGSLLKSNATVQVVAGHKVKAPADPTRDGYVFLGWYTNSILGAKYDFKHTSVEQDITLYAHWIKLLTVTFDAHGGAFAKEGTDVLSKSVTLGSKVSLKEVPARDGYTFVGWFFDKSGKLPYSFGLPVLVNFTLYAKWAKDCPQKYTVTFDSQGGSSVDPQTKLCAGAHVAEPEDPTRAGYEFDGWYSDAECTVPWVFDSDTVQSDMTLFANWIPITHTVTFDSQGGSKVNPATVAEGNPVAKPADPTRAGYTFTGWFKDAAGTKAWDFKTAITGDITLYAGWLKLPKSALPKTGDSASSLTYVASGLVIASIVAASLSLKKRRA